MSISPALKYRPDIDGLRAIAVIVVVGFHAWPREFRGGFIGVDIFFVISGYLISGILLKGLAEAKFSFAEFYVRRIKRIFPALMLVLATCAVLGWFIMWAQPYAQFGKHVVAAVGFVLNFVLWREAGYFDTEAIRKPLLHLWSLSIEEQFYLVWPAVLLLASKRAYNVAIVTALVAVASFVLNVVLVDALSCGHVLYAVHSGLGIDARQSLGEPGTHASLVGRGVGRDRENAPRPVRA